MKIAIIGSGNIGSALAQKLVEKKHTVLIGAKFPFSPNSLKLASMVGEDRFSTVEGAAQQSDIIIIAIPLKEIPSMTKSLGNVDGKIIIETTNAFGKPLTGYDSTVTAIKTLTGNPDVVKCFNSIGAEDLSNPQFGSLKADTFVAGDSKHAKDICRQLALDMGFENCYDLGGDESLPLLENLAVLWGALAYKTGLGRRIAFKILKDK